MTKQEHIYCLNRNKQYFTKERLIELADRIGADITMSMPRDKMIDIIAGVLEQRENNKR